MAGSSSAACSALRSRLLLGVGERWGPFSLGVLGRGPWGASWCQGWLCGDGERGEAGPANTSQCMSRDSLPPSPFAPAGPSPLSQRPSDKLFPLWIISPGGLGCKPHIPSSLALP